MWLYMRTGSVIVLGEATKTVMVSSSKLVMKASTQPPAIPGTISGKVMRRNTVQFEAPSETAADSAARDSPVTEARTRRRA